MKKLLAAMFVALLMGGCGEQAQKEVVEGEGEERAAQAEAKETDRKAGATNPKAEEPGEAAGLQAFLPGKMVDLTFGEAGVFQGEVRLLFLEDGGLSAKDDKNPRMKGTYRVGDPLVVLKFAEEEVLGVLEFPGGLPEVGGEAQLDVGAEEVFEGKITRIFSSYGEVPRTLADFKGLLDKPLNEREKQLVGRWEEHVNQKAPFRSWHITREDHTSSSFSIGPKYDDDGEVVPGEQARIMRHGVWCVADEVVYAVTLLQGQTVIPVVDETQVLRVPQDSMMLDLVAVDAEKRTFRWKFPEEYGAVESSPFHHRRIEAFEEPEMKPFNAPGALKGFDLLKAYEEARDSEETGGGEEGVPVEE